MAHAHQLVHSLWEKRRLKLKGREPSFHLFTLSPLKGVSHFFTFSPFQFFTFKRLFTLSIFHLSFTFSTVPSLYFTMFIPLSGAERRWPLRLKRATSTRWSVFLVVATPVVLYGLIGQWAPLTMLFVELSRTITTTRRFFLFCGVQLLPTPSNIA